MARSFPLSSSNIHLHALHFLRLPLFGLVSGLVRSFVTSLKANLQVGLQETVGTCLHSLSTVLVGKVKLSLEIPLNTVRAVL